MYLEDEDKNFTQALRTIEDKIKPVREKVRLLQQYGSILLASDTAIGQKSKGIGKEQQMIQLMIKITKFIVNRKQDPHYQPPEFENYQLERKKEIHLEEMLKVFVNNSNLMENFLRTVIESHGDNLKQICKEIQPFHKYLECLLLDYSTKIKDNTSVGISSVKEEIDRFIKVYEDKVDKQYVLFLF